MPDNHLFHHSLLDTGFKEWNRLGIKSFKDLFIHDKFASFEQLSAKCKLSNKAFFKEIYKLGICSAKLSDFPQISETNILDLLFDQQFYHGGLISIIYNNLLKELIERV